MERGMNDEYIWIKVSINKYVNLNIITIYQKQEKDMLKEEIEAFYWIIQGILEKIPDCEALIIIGDLNVKIGNDIYGINGNHCEVSKGGKILREFIVNNNLTLINNENICDGTWTRVNKKGVNIEKSILDYVITNYTGLEIIKKMKIDEEREYILEHLGTASGVTESDHNTIILDLKLSKLEINNKKYIPWNWRNSKSLAKLLNYKGKKIQ